MKKLIKYHELANKRMELKALATIFVAVVVITLVVVWNGVITIANIFAPNVSAGIGIIAGGVGAIIYIYAVSKAIEWTKKPIEEIEKEINKLMK